MTMHTLFEVWVTQRQVCVRFSMSPEAKRVEWCVSVLGCLCVCLCVCVCVCVYVCSVYSLHR